MDENTPPWTPGGHGKGKSKVVGRSAPTQTARGSSYSSSYNRPPVIRLGGRSLINSPVSKGASSSSFHLEDIPQDSPLYGQLQDYLTAKKSDTFSAVARVDNSDDIKNYEKVDKKKIIFLVESSEIQRQEEPWNILQKYLIQNLYFLGESYKTRSYYENILVNTGSVEFSHFQAFNTTETVYNFSKMIIKIIFTIE